MVYTGLLLTPFGPILGHEQPVECRLMEWPLQKMLQVLWGTVQRPSGSFQEMAGHLCLLFYLPKQGFVPRGRGATVTHHP